MTLAVAKNLTKIEMLLELVFSHTYSTETYGVVGGPCNIHSRLWPSDRKNDPLFHLVTLPASWILNDIDEKLISIFIPYDKEDFSHFEQMSPYEIDHKDSFVILHKGLSEPISKHKE